jgi:hypothetical protein
MQASWAVRVGESAVLGRFCMVAAKVMAPVYTCRCPRQHGPIMGTREGAVHTSPGPALATKDGAAFMTNPCDLAVVTMRSIQEVEGFLGCN